MTKKLEEEFNLPSMEEALEEETLFQALAFREDKTNKDWENSVEVRQQRAGGMQATMSPHSEPITCNYKTMEIKYKYCSTHA